ncbi:MAG: hypothetical protein ACXADA_24870 [Candidatus Hodarchaeales archaeon]
MISLLDQLSFVFNADFPIPDVFRDGNHFAILHGGVFLDPYVLAFIYYTFIALFYVIPAHAFLDFYFLSFMRWKHPT